MNRIKILMKLEITIGFKSYLKLNWSRGTRSTRQFNFGSNLSKIRNMKVAHQLCLRSKQQDIDYIYDGLVL